MRDRSRLLAPAAAVLAVALLAGCSPETPMEPADRDFLQTPEHTAAARPNADGLVAIDQKGGPGVVDLHLGRLTEVSGVFRARILLTGQEPGPWVDAPFTVERRIVGLETPVAGVTYRQERVLQTEPGGPTTRYDLWRQDKSGLYLYQPEEEPGPGARTVHAAAGMRARLAPDQVAAVARAWEQIDAKRAAILAGRRGGPLGSEITFLRYPLHKGASWEGREDFNVWTVEETEWIDSPAGKFHAARLNIVLPAFFGPDDSAITWWDAPGEVRRAFHLFGDATDEQGNVIGKVETFEAFTVTRYEKGPAL